jgi:hypothetical protein
VKMISERERLSQGIIGVMQDRQCSACTGEIDQNITDHFLDRKRHPGSTENRVRTCTMASSRLSCVPAINSDLYSPDLLSSTAGNPAWPGNVRSVVRVDYQLCAW